MGIIRGIFVSAFSSVPKDCKISVQAVMVANLILIFVEMFCVKLVISKAFYGNFLIWA